MMRPPVGEGQRGFEGEGGLMEANGRTTRHDETSSRLEAKGVGRGGALMEANGRTTRHDETPAGEGESVFFCRGLMTANGVD